MRGATELADPLIGIKILGRLTRTRGSTAGLVCGIRLIINVNITLGIHEDGV